jgi:hypothetical protein
MRIYVIGPVSGHDDLNAPAFEHARTALFEAGYMPLIPHDFVSADADWLAAMKRSLETLAKADAIALLEGWQTSNGARIEWNIARSLGIEIATVDEWLFRSEDIAEIAARIAERKHCPQCHRILPLSLLAASLKSADGRQVYCRSCMSEYAQDRRA